MKNIFLALLLSVVVALSTSATAWLLDPAVKKVFIDKDQTLAALIPIAIILAFSSKGISLYFARSLIIGIGGKITGELQNRISKNILISDDISMKSLKGKLKENTIKTFKAGCNLVLHCNGNLNEMEIIGKNSPLVSRSVIKKTSQFYKIIS